MNYTPPESAVFTENPLSFLCKKSTYPSSLNFRNADKVNFDNS